MAKHCTNCGHELTGTEKFCAECGTPVGSGAIPLQRPVQYETCEITYEVLRTSFAVFSSRLRFVGNAVGPNGRYVAGVSEGFGGAVDFPQPSGYVKHRQHNAVLNAFIQNLTSEGWESLGRAGNWFSYTFRRPVKG